jgi:hypothetical protein
LSFEEDTKPGTPNILREIRQCIEESRALNARLARVLQALTLDLKFRREMREKLAVLDDRLSEVERR